MENSYIIRNEREEEYREVENLVREAFWNVYRPGALEHYVLHCLRKEKDFIKELDFVMVQNNKIIGQAVYFKASIKSDDGREIPISTMGPISISPQYKRQGYGKKLLDYSLNKAKEMGIGAVCFEGNIDFYGKSGFILASDKKIHYHGESRESVVPYFLLKELKEGYLKGVEGEYSTPLPYYVDEIEAEKFDETFPKKEKKKEPWQIF